MLPPLASLMVATFVLTAFPQWDSYSRTSLSPRDVTSALAREGITSPDSALTEPRVARDASAHTVSSSATVSEVVRNVVSGVAETSGFSDALDALGDEERPERVRELAIESLADTQQPRYDVGLALLALSRIMGTGSENLRSAAIDTLALLPYPGAVDLLLQALEDSAPQLREDALYALLDHAAADHDDIAMIASGNRHAPIRESAAELFAGGSP